MTNETHDLSLNIKIALMQKRRKYKQKMRRRAISHDAWVLTKPKWLRWWFGNFAKSPHLTKREKRYVERSKNLDIF